MTEEARAGHNDEGLTGYMELNGYMRSDPCEGTDHLTRVFEELHDCGSSFFGEGERR